MSDEKSTIRLGDKVRDAVTGFSGIAVARTEWLHGCARITIQPDVLDKDGKPQDAITFDELQLQPVESQKVPSGNRETGGPRPEPSRRAEPAR